MRRLLSLAAALTACTEGTVGPDPDPVEPVLYASARFALQDFAHLPAVQVESLLARVERDYDRVAALLPDFDPPPHPIDFRIAEGNGIPFVTLGENRMTQWGDQVRPQYFTHQLAHLFTRYQQSNFIEEGLAVWVSEQTQLSGELPDPYRGQAPHAWVSLFQDHGSAISLFTALRADNLGSDYRGSSADASAWQLFVEAGSFTGWFIQQHGWDRWLVFYETGVLANAVGIDTPTLEHAWIAYVTALHPDPLSCEDALVELGTRETYWCARARGE